jgi:light-regulated signal transduction histidine kinase (bacteriophytochrome)
VGHIKKIITEVEYEAQKNHADELLYILSHDLNAPLRHIREFSRLLLERLEGRLDPTEITYANFIEKSVSRSQLLLDALLKVSRINTEAEAFVRCSSNTLFNEQLAYLSVAIKQANAQINYDELPDIYADPKQISQVFYQLIDNALKFSAGNMVVLNVSARQHNDRCLFRFEDQGIGIEEHRFEQVFKLFYKLHPHENLPGIGLGLNLCELIVTRHEGRICMEPSQHGVVIVFDLPLAF